MCCSGVEPVAGEGSQHVGPGAHGVPRDAVCGGWGGHHAHIPTPGAAGNVLTTTHHMPWQQRQTVIQAHLTHLMELEFKYSP